MTAGVVQAIAAVMQEVTSVAKDDQFNGGQTRYAYRGVDRVVKALSASIRKHGLVIVPKAHAVPEYLPVTTNGGKGAILVRVLVTYVIMHTGSGDQIEVTVPGEAVDSSDKAVAKAMSVAWRTMLLQTFFLPTDEPDPDAERTEFDGRPQQVRGGGSPANLAKLQQYDDRDQQLRSDWKDAIADARGDKAALTRLWQQATAQRIPADIIKEIEAEGNKAS